MISIEQVGETYKVLRDGNIVQENLTLSEARHIRDIIELQVKNKNKIDKLKAKVHQNRLKLKK